MKQTPQTKSTLISNCISLSMLLLAGALNQANAAATPPDGKAPLLANSLEQLQPQAVWQHFYQITQVPRPSHHEEKISAFVTAFGRSLGLETITDSVGNVIIRKPASKGYENRRGVVLQAHMDMVPQKTPDKIHDFQKDPITAYINDGWLTADRTTLGADDGIGVAIIMALLQDRNAVHGPLEALFTVNEEDGFSGINALKADVLRGDYLINVDWEVEGVLAIDNAGGVNVDALGKYAQNPPPADTRSYKLSIAGLQGGHSGVDINKGGGSASKLLVRLLSSAKAFGVRIASIEGGDRYNAIPREATAVLVVPQTQSAGFEKFVSGYEAIVKSELAATEPRLSIVLSEAPLPPKVMNRPSQDAMLNALYGSINGVLRMSDGVPGLVETSSSMGILRVGNGQWMAGMLVRSAVDSARDDVAQKLAAVMQLAGAQTTIKAPYSGWRPDPNSPLLALMKDVYRQNFGKEAGVVAVHAGLETSVVGAKYPKMDMISMGPTLIDVHSPDERLEIDTVGKAYTLLVETLKRIPAR